MPAIGASTTGGSTANGPIFNDGVLGATCPLSLDDV
jgi:hypothetical protein